MLLNNLRMSVLILKERDGSALLQICALLHCTSIYRTLHTLQILCNHLVPLQDSKNSWLLCACAIFSSCK